ncbi:outer membrane beta-barrel protein [bacterium]|nr:outer membrane beta-barrel protein [bacterium]
MFKKAILATAVVCGASFGAQAQLRVGAGLMTGLPMGDFGDAASFGIGGGVWADYFVTDNIAAGVSLGFLSYGAKEEVEGSDYSTTMIPILLTGDWHFMPGETFDFYAGVGLGFNMVSSKSTIDSGIPGIPATEVEADETAFQLVIPRIGINYMLNDTWGIDFNTGYSLVMVDGGNADYIPVNLGVFYVLE